MRKEGHVLYAKMNAVVLYVLIEILREREELMGYKLNERG